MNARDLEDVYLPFVQANKQTIFDIYCTVRIPPFTQDAMGSHFDSDSTNNQIFCKHELDSKGVCTKCHLETIDWGREKKYDRKLKLSDVEAVLDKVNIFDIPCDLGVFKLEQLVAQDVNGDSYWPKNFLTLFGQGEPPNIYVVNPEGPLNVAIVPSPV